MNVAIYLYNDISGFSIKKEQVLTLEKTFPEWKFYTCETTEELQEKLHDCHLCITWKFLSGWYRKAPLLKAIFTPSAGHDWIEKNAAYSIPVFFGSFHGPVMAESLLGMILFFNRKIPALLSNQKQHIWDRDVLSNTNRLGSQSVVLIGYGNIARECAHVLKEFGCRVIGVKHSPYDAFLDKDADAIHQPEELVEVLAKADHIVTVLPGTNENRDLLSRDLFSVMKKGAYFYNIGRGNCYRESDLLWALDQKILAGAGLDVFNEEPLPDTSPLWDRADVLIMPHGSALCKEYIPMYIRELIPKLRAFTNSGF
ncbi:MAG: D-2-hydroxyacid dehydrogenase [Fibrobacter sp.]|nr:D-2-hydroxyacid dehydrogenase [Fibrobacter sp.]